MPVDQGLAGAVERTARPMPVDQGLAGAVEGIAHSMPVDRRQFDVVEEAVRSMPVGRGLLLLSLDWGMGQSREPTSKTAY